MSDPKKDDDQEQKPYEWEIEIGAPTKFTAEAVKKAEEYVDNTIVNRQFPTIEELAIKLGVSDDSIVNWQKPREKDDKIIRKLRQDFSATIKRLMTYQKLYLTMAGLGGKATPSMAIFLLKAVHGLKEVSQIELGTIDNEIIERDRDESKKIADNLVAKLKEGNDDDNDQPAQADAAVGNSDSPS